MRPIHSSASAVAILATLLVAGCSGDAGYGGSEAASSTATASSTSTAPAATAAPAVASVGLPAPDFTLTDVAGNSVTLSEFTAAGKTVVLEWFNPDCPIVKEYHTPTSSMGPLAASYAGKNVVWLAINSGGPGLQGHGQERNERAVAEYGIDYPVLLDESGAIGKRYAATRTPHMYVISSDGILRYAGAINNGKPGSKGKLNYVSQALDELLADAEVSVPTSTAFGCGVKYAKTYE